MTLIKNIGKNTLGDNNKMNVRLHEYYMSNHDLSFVFRNTQSPGTLVPFMKIVAQKGDVFDIQLINKTLTHQQSDHCSEAINCNTTYSRVLFAYTTVGYTTTERVSV